ncbi:glycosyltransferase [Xanthobacter tagetidis]|uniref:Glycosyltransferase n=2 Tax=Xanthobacter tagetidis TaxID=60216 RepID=A0A3L7A254_9HYPH|nr:glycosyltransferase [Xanthobacter tagetidis]RLP74386.1 glycosyltransferase [Xanthobacter tagetidis]
MTHSKWFMDHYRTFEDKYRGSAELIRARLSTYLPLLEDIGHGEAGRTALDIGCGRGEWLRLLVESGWSATGVDANPSMLEEAAAEGLPVVAAEAAAFLRGCAASSFALVTAFHVVEHLTRADLADLLAEIERVLVPGGVVILETPNPENLTVASWSFHMDPTHVAPLPPHLLTFLVQSAHLQGVAILRLNSQTSRLEKEPTGSALLGLFGDSPDYSVIASKPGGDGRAAEAVPRFVAAHTEPSPADLGRLAREIGALHKAVARTEDLAAGVDLLKAETAALKDTTAALSDANRSLASEIADLQSAKAKLEADLAAAREASDQWRTQVAALADRLLGNEKLTAGIAGLRISDDRLRERIDRGLESVNDRIAAELHAVQQSQHGLDSDFLTLRLRHEELASLPLLKLLTRARKARRALKWKIKDAFRREAPLRAGLRRVDRLITRPIRDLRDSIRPPRARALAPDLPAAPARAAPHGLLQSVGERLATRRLAHALDSLRRSIRSDDRPTGSKPRLAFVAPLPPERTGIADYSAQILPELTRYYDIDVVVDQEAVSDEWVRSHCAVRTPAWFAAHAASYDRVLYHFGNSPFHTHMFNLLEQIPGVVVLHDFYLTDILNYIENNYEPHNSLTQALLTSHGYSAVLDRLSQDARDTSEKYPANFSVLSQAQGVILHNTFARDLAAQFYPEYDTTPWNIIPLVRFPASTAIKQEVRRILGFSDDDILVCSFGFIQHSKLSHRLLDAWLQSDLAHDPRCHLIFVGHMPRDAYGDEMHRTIERANAGGRIRATGFVKGDDYHHYLRAADIGVQLRGSSRGETSAAALDCLAYGLATIVNANGSMAELPTDCVVQIADAFDTSELIDALTELCTNSDLRRDLGRRAAAHVSKNHSAAEIAKKYGEAIETSAAAAPTLHSMPALVDLARRMVADGEDDDESIRRVAERLCRQGRLPRPCHRLFVDVSVLARNDLRSGIQRVVRGLLLELLKAPPAGYRIEPVRLSDVTGRWQYHLARHYTEQIFTGTWDVLIDEPAEVAAGDIFLGADFHTDGIAHAARAGLFGEWRQRGVRISFIVYDILPLTLPNCFPPYAEPTHRAWMLTLSEIADDLVCISTSVANETKAWLEAHAAHPEQLPAIHPWTLGADIDASHPTRGMPDDADAFLAMMQANDSFLMVGTLEPRKGHLQALHAFEILWAEGSQAKLIFVGKEGWRGVPQEDAQSLPELMDRLRHHPELGKRLFWLQDTSDEFLDRIYQEADCLIAASLDEGFGLPLIEAARHGIPIIARDIPVFREVAGGCATYFSGHDGPALATAIEAWLAAFRADRHPKSSQMPWLTWAESAQRLKEILATSSRTDLARKVSGQ